MAKYKELTYQKTVNLGNYESEKIGITVTLEEGDNIDLCFEKIKSKVMELKQ